jgi:choice-of-anchor A domain-containing protein
VRVPGLPLWCLTAAVACGSAADAQSLTASQILQQFNAVIFDNFTSNSDVEGRTVIGGNVTGGATFALNPTAEAASQLAALTVYGDVTGTGSFNVDNASGLTIGGTNAGGFTLNDGGSVYIGSTNSGNITIDGGSTSTDGVSINGNNTGYLTLNNGGTVKINGNAGSGSLNGGSLTYTGTIGSWNLNGGATKTKVSSLSLPPPANLLPSFTSTFEQPLTALSSQLAALTPNSTVLTSGNSVTLVAHPNSSGVAVLDISTSVFAANDSVSVSLNGAKSFIINLTVANCHANCTYSFPSSVNFQSPTSYADNVLWNVTDVSSLSFTTQFGGTVLAPTAAVKNNGPIDGTLVALSFNGGGELHDYPFDGPLPAPEPPGLAVLSVALVGTGVLCRRRRRSQL